MDDTPAIEIRLFGSLQIGRHGRPVTNFTSRKAEALFAYITIDRRAHPREVLADLLWDDRTQKQALGNLRVLINNLRQLFPEEITSSRKTFGLKPEVQVWADTAVLDHALQLDNKQLTAETAAALTQALDLATGPFLSGFHLRDALRFEEWLTLERERWQQKLLTALDQLTHFYIAHDQLDHAAVYAQKLVHLDPLRERSQQQLMRILARRGEANLALEQYQQFTHLLETELSLPPEPETQRLYQRIRQTKISPAGHLPRPENTLIGRLSELAQIDQRLDEDGCRLLTIIGIGGVGKTRLAQALAQRRAHDYLNGLFFVPLAAANNLQTFLHLLIETLSIPVEAQTPPTQQIIDYLRERELLLILDNMEQLIAETVSFIQQLLQQAPDLQIVITSRERLLLRQEWVFQLAGLPIDNSDDASAQALLLERMGQVAPDLALTPEVKSAAQTICHLVDGVPLALELAAAASAYHPPATIAAEITTNLDFLRTRMRNLPDRHRSIRAMFAHSWTLLSAEEQTLFSALSVFSGGFSAAAAQEICGSQRHLLESLQTKSLLQREPNGRYMLHQLLRQYAAEQLATHSKQLATVYQQHGRYYSRYIAQQQTRFNKTEMAAAFQHIGQEYDNILAAWQRFLTAGDEAGIQTMAAGLALYHYIRGRLQPGLVLFSTSAKQLNAHGVSPSLLAEMLAWQALFLTEVGQYEQAIKTAAQALTQPTAPHKSQAIALYCQGYALWSTGSYEEAQDKLTQAAALANTENLAWVHVQSLSTIGNALLDQGDVTAAQEKYHQGLAIAQTVQHPRIEASLRINLGNSYWHSEAYTAARFEFEQALKLCQQFNIRQIESLALNNIGLVDSELGQFPTALEAIQQALTISREVGDRRGEGNALLNLVAVQIECGDLRHAWQYLEDAHATCRAVGDKQGEGIVLEHYGTLYLRAGAYAQAADYLNQAWAINNDLGESWGLATIAIWQGLLTLYTDNLSAAHVQAHHGRERAQALQDQSTEALAHMVMGHLSFAAEQYQPAAEAYAQAASLYAKVARTHLTIEFRPAWLLCRLFYNNKNKGNAPTAAEIDTLVEQLMATEFPGIYEPGRMFADGVRLLETLEDSRAKQLCAHAAAYLHQLADQLPPHLHPYFWAAPHNRPFAPSS